MADTTTNIATSDDTLQVLRIVRGTSVDGPGLRTSVYLAGCTHQCPGCHNQQSWDFAGGETMTVDHLLAEIADDDEDVTLTGGDPMQHPTGVLKLARRIKEELHRSLWCFTGYRWEQLLADEKMRHMLDYIDVVVDGEFVMAKRDIKLRFRGSSNQRLIDVKKSLAAGHAIEWADDAAPIFP